MRWLLAFSLLISIPASSLTETLEDNIRAFLKNTPMPAVGVATLNRGRLEVAVAGVRKSGDSTQARLTDKWHLGSMTKSMTAILVAVAVDEGLLEWESTPADVFDFAVHDDFKDIPLTRFLTHTSGLIDSVVFDDQELVSELLASGKSNVELRRMVAEQVLAQPVSEAPGVLRYSNLGYMLVGAMLETVTGQSWEELMTTRLFEPLQMASCGFGPTTMDPTVPPVQPWGHRRDEGGDVVPISPGPLADNPAVIGPAGTVHCALADLAKYVQLHLDQASGRQTVLGLVSTAPLYRDVHDVAYTAGAFVVEENSEWAGGSLLWHNGSNTFNYSLMQLAPDSDKAVMAVTNYGAIDEVAPLIKELASAVRN